LITLNGVVTNQATWALDYFDDEAKAEAIAALASRLAHFERKVKAA
jgi:hypothetical protein